MTTTYQGNNTSLEYDAATGTWVFKNTAQDFVDPNTFSTSDTSFEYAPVVDDDKEEDTTCPEGYTYDTTLKQCVPVFVDNNYMPMERNTDYEDRLERESSGVYIPSNKTKENWIKNANTIIPAGQEGAGKTGYQNFIDNLDDRGWIKNEGGKMIFKKDNIGSALGAAMLSKGGMDGQGEVEAKTNKIIKDLQRMGGINAQITMDDDGNIDFASELELSNSPGTFAIDNYDEENFYTGFTTPTGDTFKTTGTFGTAGYTSSWDNYMAAIMKPFTSTSSSIKNYNTYLQESGVNDIEKEKARKAKFDADISKAKAEREAQQTIRDYEKAQEEKQEREERQEQEDNKAGSGSTGGYAGDTSGRGGTGGSGGYTPPYEPPKKEEKPDTGYQRRRGSHHY